MAGVSSAPRAGLSVRALNAIDLAVADNATPESVKAWAIGLTGEASPTTATVANFLRRRKNVGERIASEILAYAWALDLPRTATLRLECSACGDRAELKASGAIADRFVQWWATEHKHEES